MDAEERQEKLYTALELCKKAAPDLPLKHICEQVSCGPLNVDGAPSIGRQLVFLPLPFPFISSF